MAHKIARATRFNAGIHNYDCIPGFVISTILEEMK